MEGQEHPSQEQEEGQMIDDNGKTREDNLITLKEYLQREMLSCQERRDIYLSSIKENTRQALEALAKHIDTMFEMNKIAVDKAEKKLDERLGTMNEIRDTLKDQAATFFTRKEFDMSHEKVVEDIKVLMKSKAIMETKASMNAVYVSYAIAIIAMIASLIDILHR